MDVRKPRIKEILKCDVSIELCTWRHFMSITISSDGTVMDEGNFTAYKIASDGSVMKSGNYTSFNLSELRWIDSE